MKLPKGFVMKCVVMSSVLAVFCLAAAAPGSMTLSGASAEKIVFAQVVAPLRSFDSSLAISAPSCPNTLDLSNGKIGYCTLTVNGETEKVPLAYLKAAHQFGVPASSVYEMGRLEQTEAVALSAQDGVPATVDCGAPRLRIYLVGTVFSCKVTGDPKNAVLQLKAGPNGQIANLNAEFRAPKWATDAIALHDAGKPTVLAGPNVEAFLTKLLQMNAAADAKQASAIAVKCPAALDVSGTKHAQCVVTYNGLTLRRDVFIDRATGLRSASVDAYVDLARVQESAQAGFNDYLRREGKSADGTVRCSSGAKVVTPPAKFNCAADADGQAYRVEVSVPDASGSASWEFVPVDKDIAPDPATTPGH